MSKFVPSGYLSIREALNRLGRELFPLEWSGEEDKARRNLMSEEEWLRIKGLPPAFGSGAGIEPKLQRPTNMPSVQILTGMQSMTDYKTMIVGFRRAKL